MEACTKFPSSVSSVKEGLTQIRVQEISIQEGKSQGKSLSKGILAANKQKNPASGVIENKPTKEEHFYSKSSKSVLGSTNSVTPFENRACPSKYDHKDKKKEEARHLEEFLMKMMKKNLDKNAYNNELGSSPREMIGSII